MFDPSVIRALRAAYHQMIFQAKYFNMYLKHTQHRSKNSTSCPLTWRQKFLGTFKNTYELIRMSPNLEIVFIYENYPQVINYCIFQVFNIRYPEMHNVQDAKCAISSIVYPYEPRCEKTGLRGFRPSPTQTGLYNHRNWLEA